ncbi:MAG: FecR domain-containing protein [Phycisphaerales bacterium]
MSDEQMNDFDSHSPSDKNDRYLWDKSGPVDRDIEQLERKLQALRHEGDAPQMRISIRRWRIAPLAIAAVLTLAAGVTWMMFQSADKDGAWNVVAMKGTPTIDSVPLVGEGRLAVGDWLETDKNAQVRVEVADIGDVTVHPNSRLKLLVSEADKKHGLQLARGSIEAFIFAPPRLFFVETASAVAVDLGCQYLLQVDEQGTGRLEVLSGWVSFEHDAIDSIVPRDGVCQTRAGIGPGTPYFNDTSDEFVQALVEFDFQDGGEDAMNVIVTQARPRDTLTLWHLLSRVDGAQRDRVFDRMTSFSPPPDEVTRDGVLRLDEQMLEDWWDALQATW